MEITYLGHSCFRLKGKDVTLVTDPYNTDGGRVVRQQVDIVTISHDHPGHNNVGGIDGQPRVFRGPGEYEVAGVYIVGLAAFHDDTKGARLGKNTLYVIEIDGLHLCHMGDLGHPLSSSAVEDIGRLDVLFLPVGGGSTIDGTAAAEVVRRLRPGMAIPMHFRSGARPDLEPLDRFLKETGQSDVSPRPRLSVSAGNIPQETEVVVLEHPLTP